MKELSIEEKARRYDEAIKLAKDSYNYPSYPGFIRADVVFPELKESEDERIRKAIHIYLDWLDGRKDCQPKGDYTIKDMIAWLEKQKEYESTDFEYVWNRTDCGALTSALDKYSEEAIINMCHAWYDKGIELERRNWLEKQGEQKQTDKVEPKFHEGEWIVQENIGTYKVIEVRESWYKVIDVEDNHYSIAFDKEYMCHLWTIQDAKPGDVLVCKGDIKYSNGIKYEKICLFNNLDNAFFTLTKTSNYKEEYDIDVNIDYPDNIVPATKEQKEILFMAMKEAGYEWSDKNRKLSHSKVTKISDKVQKSTWSEEDEVKINRIVACLENLNVADNDILLKDVDWLKSLRPQNRWKPTKQQLSELRCVISGCSFETSVLVELEKNLKKLL